MRSPLQVGDQPAQAVLDGAIGLGLATGVPLRLRGPLQGADLSLILAAVKLGGDFDAARELLSRSGEVELALPHPRAGMHVLDFAHPGAIARALWTLSWPLALLGKPSELRLRGPNHSDDMPTFHDLRLGWAPFASRFGLKIGLELTQAGFGTEEGEIVATLDPAPALTPLRAVHRGLLRQVTVVAAVDSDFVPVVKVVEVAVMFQPAPDPVASETSSAWAEVGSWLRPLRVAEKLTAGGRDTNPSEPAVNVAVAVVA